MLRLGRAFGRLRLGRAAVLGIAVGLLAAGGLGWLAEARLTELLLTQAAERAVDQAQLVVAQQVTAADLSPPFDSAKLARVEAALGPLLHRVRQPGSGIVRVNVFGRDGTVLASDEPGLRGHKVATDDAPLLAAALRGDTAAERSAFQGVENADLRSRFGEALEVYVPLERDGQITGAYELYLDLSTVEGPRRVVWIVVVAALSSLGSLAASRLARPARPTRGARRRGPDPGGGRRGPLRLAATALGIAQGVGRGTLSAPSTTMRGVDGTVLLAVPMSSWTRTRRRCTPLPPMPWRFHTAFGSTGWTLPAASVARTASSYSPGVVACHTERKGVHENGPTAGKSSASVQVWAPSVLTSTRVIGIPADQAMPCSVWGPGAT